MVRVSPAGPPAGHHGFLCVYIVCVWVRPQNSLSLSVAVVVGPSNPWIQVDFLEAFWLASWLAEF